MIGSNSKIVFFGDSLTHRTGVTQAPNPAHKFNLDYTGSYVDILVKKMLVHYPEVAFEYYNLGVGGNTTVDLLNRVQEVLRLGPDWADRTWHLFVVNWKGTHFEVSMDGGGLKSASLSCKTSAGDVKQLIVGGSKEPTLIDEFMIYRRPLTEVDVRTIVAALRPRPLRGE